MITCHKFCIIFIATTVRFALFIAFFSIFIENGPGYKGKRLFMTKAGEEQDSELLYSLRRKQYPNDKQEVKFLVFFKLDKELPLVVAGG